MNDKKKGSASNLLQEAMDRAIRDTLQPTHKDPALRLYEPVYLPGMATPSSIMAESAQHALEAATHAVQMLASTIRKFEAGLQKDETLAFMMIGGPAGLQFFPQTVRAANPDKIIFEGLDENKHPFVVVQHISQLNFALRVAKLEAEEVRRPIGFVFPKER